MSIIVTQSQLLIINLMQAKMFITVLLECGFLVLLSLSGSMCSVCADISGDLPLVSLCSDNTATGQQVILDAFPAADSTSSTCFCSAILTSANQNGYSISPLFGLNPGYNECGTRFYISVQSEIYTDEVERECDFIQYNPPVGLQATVNITYTKRITPGSENNRYCLSMGLVKPGNITLSCSDPQLTAESSTTVSVTTTMTTTTAGTTTTTTTAPVTTELTTSGDVILSPINDSSTSSCECSAVIAVTSVLNGILVVVIVVVSVYCQKRNRVLWQKLQQQSSNYENSGYSSNGNPTQMQTYEQLQGANRSIYSDLSNNSHETSPDQIQIQVECGLSTNDEYENLKT